MRPLRITCFVSSFLVLFSGTGCKKFVQAPPPVTAITGNNVYINNATAIAVLTGIYNSMSSGGFATGNASISVYAGLAADELQGTAGISLSPAMTPFYLNALNGTNSPFWSQLYSYIHLSNAAIDGLNASSTLNDSVKRELLGEAKFVRALFYFYVVNLFGDAPLVLSSAYTNNEHLARAPQAQVYQQIITDLLDAQGSLSSGYVKSNVLTIYPSSAERVRPNKYAAAALLARVYLCTGDNVHAEVEADSVIANTALYGLVNLNNAFLKNTTEAIWQLQPTTSYYCTLDGNLFVMTAAPPTSSVWLNNNLVNAFEPNDQRMVNWVGVYNSGSQAYYFPNKYKIKVGTSPTAITEYLMVLRLAEQYLIRAEARANQGNLTGATNDLNIIRNRAGLPGTTASTQTDLISAILREKRIELFSEWGHRWLDLKRTNTVDAIMDTVCSQKGGTWSTNWKLWPILNLDILSDPNLTQNTGY